MTDYSKRAVGYLALLTTLGGCGGAADSDGNSKCVGSDCGASAGTGGAEAGASDVGTQVVSHAGQSKLGGDRESGGTVTNRGGVSGASLTTTSVTEGGAFSTSASTIAAGGSATSSSSTLLNRGGASGNSTGTTASTTSGAQGGANAGGANAGGANAGGANAGGANAGGANAGGANAAGASSTGGSTLHATGGAANAGAGGTGTSELNLNVICNAGASAAQGGAGTCSTFRVDPRPPICGVLSAAPRLVAFYPFTGDLADASPKPNPSPAVMTAGSPSSISPWTDDRFGNARAAIHFDGQSSVDIPNAERLNGMSEFTLAAWVNAEVTDDGIILSKITPNRDFVMKFEPTQGGVLSSHFAINYSEYYFAYGSPITKSVWTFVAAVWTGCRWGLYVNGLLVGEREVTNGSRPAWTGTLLQIGNSAAGYAGFRGAIDDVRIYDKALTNSELLWVMGL